MTTVEQAKNIRISEIFGPTIQGEGALIGQPTIFVRTGGCDYRCHWCDTLHAVDSDYRREWTPMRAKDILTEIEGLSGGVPLMVSLSGGNPAIQPLGALIKSGRKKGYRFALETQGSIAQAWFSELDILTLSPKPPSSGMDVDFDMLDACVAAAGPHVQVSLKFVIADEADYAFARSVSSRYSDLPVYLQPCNSAPPPQHVEQAGLRADMLRLIEMTLEDRWFNVHILPQLHVWLWGNTQGV